MKGLADAEHFTLEAQVEYRGTQIDIKKIAQHYYIPLITSLSEDEKNALMRYVITVKSEIEFLKKLEEYISQPDNRFKEFDWWMFSKLDQTNDKVFIPYYNRNTNGSATSSPTPFFGCKKAMDYYIAFKVPEGTKITDHEHKADG